MAGRERLWKLRTQKTQLEMRIKDSPEEQDTDGGLSLPNNELAH